MNAIIIEDEAPARKQLESYCKAFDFIQLVGTYIDTSQAANDIISKPIDLIFLDVIAQETENNINLLKSICKDKLVIITTGHKEHAYESFRMNTIELLEKPIEEIEFQKAVHKAYERYRKNNDKFWIIKNMKIPLDNIAYISSTKSLMQQENKASQNKQKIDPRAKTIILKEDINNNKHITLTDNDLSFDKVEAILPSAQFIRVNKKTIIAKDYIFERIQSDLIRLQNGNEISIGKKYLKTIDEIFR